MLEELSFESTMTAWMEWHGVEDCEFSSLRTLDICTAPRLLTLGVGAMEFVVCRTTATTVCLLGLSLAFSLFLGQIWRITGFNG